MYPGSSNALKHTQISWRLEPRSYRLEPSSPEAPRAGSCQTLMWRLLDIPCKSGWACLACLACLAGWAIAVGVIIVSRLVSNTNVEAVGHPCKSGWAGLAGLAGLAIAVGVIIVVVNLVGKR